MEYVMVLLLDYQLNFKKFNKNKNIFFIVNNKKNYVQSKLHSAYYYYCDIYFI